MKDPKFPGMRWHPETGENRIFNSAAEVPDGWQDRHPADTADAKPAPPPTANPLPMSKAEVKAALTAGGIAFEPRLGHKALYEILVVSLKEHLTAAGIEFPADATAPQLLALVSNNE